MAKSKTPNLKLPRPTLLVPLAEAERGLTEQIKQGGVLCDRKISEERSLNAAQGDYVSWLRSNTVLLQRIFSNRLVADEYIASFQLPLLGFGESAAEATAIFQSVVRAMIEELESIRGRLAFFLPAPEVATPVNAEPAKEYSRRVFVVHGHDGELKVEVARLLERLDFEPVILHEQADRGQTIIEKFEGCPDLGFAVILLTPDDVGGKKPTPGGPADLKPRARQNVVFEFGFFVAKLGRERVATLYKEGTELPSDITGVIFTRVDADGAWKHKLAREMEAAGYGVDFGKIR